MKNFVTIILMISFSLSFITCARIDNSSGESTWLDEQLIDNKRYDELEEYVNSNLNELI